MDSSTAGRLVQYAERASLGELGELAAFTSVSPPTALGWVSGSPLPKGETLLRLQYFLELKGLKPEELDNLPLPAYKLGQYIAYNAIGVNEAMDELGYANANGLYQVLRGADLTATRVDKLEQLLARYEKEAAVQLARYSTAVTTPESDDAPSEPTASAVDRSQGSPSFLAGQVAGSILATSMLVGFLVGSKDLDGIRAVRELVGATRIEDLVVALMEITD